MKELSLFSGAGGGLLGTILLGWTHIGYVEYNDYCQRVIAQRIEDGYLTRAPIFGDIRAFVSEGYAASYTGLVDVISAGFPCQPFSTAGKRQGADDSRNMWPATIDCIRVVRPDYCLLENVPGLLSSGYFGTILGDLAESGYDARWRILSATELGAPHRRDRLWIVGYSERCRRTSESFEQKWPILGQRAETLASTSLQQNISHAEKQGLEGANAARAERTGGWASELCQDVPNTEVERLSERWDGQGKTACENRTTQRSWIDDRLDGHNWWATEPDVGRVAHGVASRVDRLKAIGNGQVAPVVAAVWRLLNA